MDMLYEVLSKENCDFRSNAKIFKKFQTDKKKF